MKRLPRLRMRLLYPGVLGAIAVATGSVATGCLDHLLYFHAPHTSAVHSASQGWSCPSARLRADVERTLPSVPAVPPDEVASDTDRLAIWRDNHKPESPKYIYRVEGCGHTGLFSCGYRSMHANSGWYCDELSREP